MKSLDRRAVVGRCLVLSALVLMISGVGWNSLLRVFQSQGAGQRWIEQDSVFDRSLSGGQTHQYRVRMASDQSLRVIVEQRGIDLELLVYNPDGVLIQNYDSPTHEQGNEYGLLVARADGDFTLEARSVFENSATGHYRLWVEYLGPASARDRNLFEGLVLDFQVRKLAASWARERREQILDVKEQALERYRASGHARAIYLCREELAELFSRQGEPERALDLLRQLLREAGEPGRAETFRVAETWAHLDWLAEQDSAAHLHRIIGAVYFQHGAPERALGYFESAAHAERSNERWRIDAIRWLGLAYLDMGEARSALGIFRGALGYWQEQGHPQRISLALGEVGMAYEAMGELSKAQDAYARSLELAKLSSFRPYHFPIALIQVGRMELAHGREKGALDRFEEALGHLQNPLRDCSRVLFEIAEVHRIAGRRQQARAIYSRALAEAKKHGNREQELWIHYRLAQLHQAKGSWAEALELGRKALGLVEAERRAMLNPHLTNPLLASSRPVYELQIELLMELHQRDPDAGYANEAFEVSELSRARSLLEALPQEGKPQASTKPDLQDERRRLAERLDSTMDVRRSSGDSRKAVLLPSGEASSVNAEQLDLLNRQAEVDTGLRALAVRAEPLGVSAIQEQVLDADTLLLEYFLGERSSWLWVVTRERLVTFELAPRAEIEAVAQKLYDAVTARAIRRDFETDDVLRSRVEKADRDYPGATAELSHLLLAPLAGLLDDQRLVIVGDEMLQSIPFAVLIRPGSSGMPEPLMVRHEIVGAPSASVLASLRRRPVEIAPATRTLTILADPVFEADDTRFADSRSVDSEVAAVFSPESLPDQGRLRDALRSRGLGVEALARLRGTGEEARRISSRLSENEAFVALGFEATRDLALAGGLSSSRILHFASHAVMASDYPELSGIVLTQFDAERRPLNGFLTAADIRRLKLSADLVVLSACRTALGKDVRGEGLLGLHRGFMAAGIPAVLASVWSPQDRATAELMDRFYQGLLEQGLGPAAALRQAQISLWREGYQPYHWGGFVLQGDWRALAIRDSTTRRALASSPSPAAR